MKKVLLFLLLSVGVSAYAQKSYINIYARGMTSYYDNENYGQELYISGDLPEGIKHRYSQSGSDRFKIGDLLNLLSGYGFEVECITGTDAGVNYLLSKKQSDSSNGIKHIRANDDSEVYEVARYNLQGIPISENEKGVQIVVYSNYTTKTVIKE